MDDFSKESDRTKSIALMLAAAYWRGRLHTIHHVNGYNHTFEKMVEAAAKADMDEWIAAARGHDA